jgi:inosine/xanthosine triphosphate pyrophosphatase family protein
MDEMAPAVKGTVKVTRLTDLAVAAGGRQAQFKIVWDLYDDTEASYNITGEWTGPITVHTSEEIE